MVIFMRQFTGYHLSDQREMKIKKPVFVRPAFIIYNQIN